jgi:hypothetical protein
MKSQSSHIVKTETAHETSKAETRVEISPEAQVERLLLTSFLLDQKEELIKERNRRQRQIDQEQIELRSGKTVSIAGIREYVTALKRAYSAIFPNDNPFFANMFRLHPKLMTCDPKKYEKPFLAGRLLTKLTYNRFHTEFSQEVLGALVVLAMPDGVRIYKCHEFLTPAGVEHLIRFRDEANQMMEKYEDGQWYEFLRDFSAKYKQVFQPNLL